jgi:ATP-binding cassette, subfamily B, bacterial
MQAIIKIIQATKSLWPFYLTGSILVIVTSLLNLANPLINKQIVDLIIANIDNGTNNWDKLVWFLALIIVIDLFSTVLSSFSGLLGDRLGARLNTVLTTRFYKKVLNLEVEYFDNESSGKILNKLQRGIENITNFVNQTLNNFLPFVLTALFTILFLVYYSWEIALLLALLFPAYIFISEKSSRQWIKRQNEINTVQDTTFGRVLEAISSIRVVKSFQRIASEFDFFKTHRTQIEKLTNVQSRDYYLFDWFRQTLLNVMIFAIYSYIIYYTYNQRFSISEMILLIQLVNQARFPLFAMSFILGQIQRAQAGSKDFFEVISLQSKINDVQEPKSLENVKGDICFDKVTFGYNQESTVLNHIDFDLESGKKLAVIGESGEGKSTVANLLLRFYEPKEGKIMIDGVDISKVKQDDLHKQIAVVLQESYLFSGTIKENIQYGKVEASEEEIIRAAKAANAFDFIQKLPRGFDSEIGERGVKLSGGQKQRISIARAILKDSPILILDEATSSLDSKAEKEVQKGLNELMEGRTAIVIAHRLSTIKDADYIIVLKNGEILEQGTPEDLYKQKGIYTELVDLQKLDLTQRKDHKRLKDFYLD